jgi:D-glycero-alpha-D-manno-heptose-7-phosphate kinase
MSNDQIEHRAVRAALKLLKITAGVEIHHDGDLPARSGIGSSSSFTVGLLNTLHAMKHRMMSKMELAEQAIHVERHILKEAVGSQDQAIAAFGGLNKILFSRNDKIMVEPVILGPEKMIEFQDHLMLYFTGFSRFACEIAKEQIRETKNRAKELHQMRGMVDEGLSILTGTRSLDRFGKLLHEAWKLKRGLTRRITTPEIDAMYTAGNRAGALGGKLLGAGGGGFMLFFVKPEKQKRFREKMKKLLEIPFRFDFSGSQIIFYNSR